jgi:hypothetical protein
MLKSFRYYDSEEMKIKIGFFGRRKIENTFFYKDLVFNSIKNVFRKIIRPYNFRRFHNG